MVRFAEDTLRVITTVHGHVDRRLAGRGGPCPGRRRRRAPVRRRRGARTGGAGAARRGLSRRAGVHARRRAGQRAGQRARDRPVAGAVRPPHHAGRRRGAGASTSRWTPGCTASPACATSCSAWEQLVTARRRVRPPGARRSPPLQLPRVPGDAWLGLRLPPGRPLDDRPAALHGPLRRPRSTPRGPLCGLLLDEWSETIPGDDVDTGLDVPLRPPQHRGAADDAAGHAAQFRGAWQWDDLVDALQRDPRPGQARAIEPRTSRHVPYAPLLPATVMATQARQLTIAADLAFNNRRRAGLAAALTARTGPCPSSSSPRDRRRGHRQRRGPASRRGTGSRAGLGTDRFDRALASRGARRAVAADPPVADGRVPG